MSTTTTPVTQTDIDVANAIKVPITIIHDLSPVQKGWLNMAVKREATTTVLSTTELKIQGFLNGIIEDKDLPSVQNKLKNAKEEAATAKDCRLQFTRLIDEKLIAPLMVYEKRNDELITTAGEHEKTLRIAVVNQASVGNEKNKEVALYKAHIENEKQRVMVEYRNLLSRRVNFYYTGALEQKMDVTLIEQYKKDIAAELPNIEVPVAVKFVRKLVSVDEAKEIVAGITMYQPAEDLRLAIESIETTFAMYAQDLKNAAEAIAQAKNLQEEKEASASQEQVIDAGINNLAAAAGIVDLTAGVKVKKTKKIIEHDNESFMLLVVTNFLKKYNDVKKYLKNKSQLKLSVQQMCDALSKHITDTGEKLVGLETEEVTK